MQNISDTISKGTESVKNTANELIEYLKSNPRLASMLLAGGGAGLAGGMLTAGGPEREGETKGSRRLRILRNALLAGGAGAGAVGLGSEAFKRVEQAIPADQPHPVSALLTSPSVRIAGGAGGALAGMAAGGKKDIDDVLIAGATKLTNNQKSPSGEPKGPLATFMGLDDKNVSRKGQAEFVKRHLPSGASVDYSDPLNNLVRKMVKNEKTRETMHKILGSRARQMGVAGGAVGLFAPEIMSKGLDALEYLAD